MSVHPIDVVNAYRDISGKAVSYARNELSASRFIAWCDRNEVDPLRFLKARLYLAKEGGRQIPALGALPSKALLEDDAWEEILDRAEGAEQDAEFVRSELEKHHERLLASLRALTPMHEKFKSHYRDKRIICMTDLRFSGGYHPLSKECAECSIMHRCAKRLNFVHGFDVVALRVKEGHIGYVRVE